MWPFSKQRKLNELEFKEFLTLSLEISKRIMQYSDSDEPEQIFKDIEDNNKLFSRIHKLTGKTVDELLDNNSKLLNALFEPYINTVEFQEYQDKINSITTNKEPNEDKLSDTSHFIIYDEKTKEMHSEFRYRGANDFDTFPQGYGDFGTSVTNPIPTCGITGSSEYLACLRTENGEEISAKRLGSTGAKNIKEIIDWYEIYNKRTKERLCELYLCPYSKQTSSLAPKGFTLI